MSKIKLVAVILITFLFKCPYIFASQNIHGIEHRKVPLHERLKQEIIKDDIAEKNAFIDAKLKETNYESLKQELSQVKQEMIPIRKKLVSLKRMKNFGHTIDTDKLTDLQTSQSGLKKKEAALQTQIDQIYQNVEKEADRLFPTIGIDAYIEHSKIIEQNACQKIKKIIAENEILDAENEILDAKNEILDAENEILDAKNEMLDKDLKKAIAETEMLHKDNEIAKTEMLDKDLKNTIEETEMLDAKNEILDKDLKKIIAKNEILDAKTEILGKDLKNKIAENEMLHKDLKKAIAETEMLHKDNEIAETEMLDKDLKKAIAETEMLHKDLKKAIAETEKIEEDILKSREEELLWKNLNQERRDRKNEELARINKKIEELQNQRMQRTNDENLSSSLTTKNTFGTIFAFGVAVVAYFSGKNKDTTHPKHK